MTYCRLRRELYTDLIGNGYQILLVGGAAEQGTQCLLPEEDRGTVTVVKTQVEGLNEKLTLMMKNESLLKGLKMKRVTIIVVFLPLHPPKERTDLRRAVHEALRLAASREKPAGLEVLELEIGIVAIPDPTIPIGADIANRLPTKHEFELLGNAVLEEARTEATRLLLAAAEAASDLGSETSKKIEGELADAAKDIQLSHDTELQRNMEAQRDPKDDTQTL